MWQSRKAKLRKYILNVELMSHSQRLQFISYPCKVTSFNEKTRQHSEYTADSTHTSITSYVYRISHASTEPHE